MPFWQFYQKSANWLDWPALLVQPSISAHRKWQKMVVSASTNQVWTKITIRTYARSFAFQIQIQAVCHWLCDFIKKYPKHLIIKIFVLLKIRDECLKYLIRKNISNVTKFRISEYYEIFVHFQEAVSELLAVSVLYIEKNQNKYYILIWKFEISSHIK